MFEQFRAILALNGKPIVPGVRVRHTAFIKRDGPSHSGTVKLIEWPETEPPVIVVAMDDGSEERWGTTWTAEGPWDLTAPFRTERGNVIGARS